MSVRLGILAPRGPLTYWRVLTILTGHPEGIKEDLPWLEQRMVNGRQNSENRRCKSDGYLTMPRRYHYRTGHSPERIWMTTSGPRMSNRLVFDKEIIDLRMEAIILNDDKDPHGDWNCSAWHEPRFLRHVTNCGAMSPRSQYSNPQLNLPAIF